MSLVDAAVDAVAVVVVVVVVVAAAVVWFSI